MGNSANVRPPASKKGQENEYLAQMGLMSTEPLSRIVSTECTISVLHWNYFTRNRTFMYESAICIKLRVPFDVVRFESWPQGAV